MQDKTVGTIMTPIQDVFMVHIDTILDFKTMNAIQSSGHSRIPIYGNSKIEDNRGVLFAKDLTFIGGCSPQDLSKFLRGPPKKVAPMGPWDPWLSWNPWALNS